MPRTLSTTLANDSTRRKRPLKLTFDDSVGGVAQSPRSCDRRRADNDRLTEG